MKASAFTFLLCFVVAGICNAQLNYDYTEGKFFIKGKVIDVQAKKPVPLASVRLLNTNKGVVCDNDGAFVIYVTKKDTLKFTCSGYISKTILIADLDSTKYYTLEIQLMQDFIKLKDVVVYPFRDLDEFKKAFIETKEAGPVSVYGIAPPKYSNQIPKANLANPVSFLYEKMKRRRAANPRI